MTTAASWEIDPYLELLRESDIETYLQYLKDLVLDINSARFLISYELTPTNILQEVAKKHEKLRFGVLQHQNCPRELIQWAINEGSEETFRALISTPLQISGQDIAAIWSKSEIAQKVALTARQDCPTDILMDTWNLDFSQDSLFENNREDAFKNIASHPNIPKKLIVEFMKYPLETIIDGNLTLGQLLLQNPSLTDETKALLVLRGVEKKSQGTQGDPTGHLYWWPSNYAYEARSKYQSLREFFSEAGHPESILDTRESLSSSEYSPKTALQYWLSDNKSRIYKCLWPDLTKNPKVNFFYKLSSWDGAYAYVGVAGDLDLNDDDFKNKVHEIEKWIISSNTLSFEDVVGEISDRGFVDLLESDPHEEIIVAAAIVENTSGGLFTITEKGKKYIQEAGNDWFEDEVTYLADVTSDPSQKIWSELGSDRQRVILSVIRGNLIEKENENFNFAEYLGALIALNPSNTSEVLDELRSLPSELIKKALNV